ncbi:MAG TPA: glucose-6-phosphate dehydrogenase assembly protein OpcA [Chthoniobacterales bacterium]|nr:glucose-6-phosphate dehydrogenase assembly protein OpcA [Chthoniobacterales bacterium]
MPAVAETFSLGAPVEIGRIEKELKKLWAQGEAAAMTRASLINLAVYSDEPGSLGKNTQLMSQLTEDHACRAIVIEADSTAKENIAEAWISAHCHVSRAGSRQICSEQLSFRLGGPCTTLLPSIVFSHLDSDLPFYLWWQTELPKKIDPHLWSWVDHLIYDSQTWPDYAGQMQLVETAKKEADQRIVLCDINWTRLDKIRAAVAQFFDHPGAHHHFQTIDDVKIAHAPGFHSTAVLLAGWLAAQLKWTEGRRDKSSLQFSGGGKRQIMVQLQESAGEPISEISLRSGSTEFAVKHSAGADLLVVTRHDNGDKRMDQRMPAGKNDPVALLSDQLMRGGVHAVYLRVIEQVRGLI